METRSIPVAVMEPDEVMIAEAPAGSFYGQLAQMPMTIERDLCGQFVRIPNVDGEGDYIAMVTMWSERRPWPAHYAYSETVNVFKCIAVPHSGSPMRPGDILSIPEVWLRRGTLIEPQFHPVMSGEQQ